jgi:hypothetical protein
MGWRVVRRSDGFFAIWSSVVDDFIADDLDEELVQDVYRARAIRDADERAARAIASATDDYAELKREYGLA